MENQLTAPERSDLRQLEEIIAAGLKTFIDVGKALQAIKDQKLYRENYTTFESYVKQRWDMSSRHAYRLIDAAEVTGNFCDQLVTKITNEGQARELGKIPDEYRTQVLEQAVEVAQDRLTAAVIKQAAEEFFRGSESILEEDKEIERSGNAVPASAVAADWRELKSAARQYADCLQRTIDDLAEVRPHENYDKAIELCCDLIVIVANW